MDTGWAPCNSMIALTPALEALNAMMFAITHAPPAENAAQEQRHPKKKSFDCVHNAISPDVLQNWIFSGLFWYEPQKTRRMSIRAVKIYKKSPVGTDRRSRRGCSLFCLFLIPQLGTVGGQHLLDLACGQVLGLDALPGAQGGGDTGRLTGGQAHGHDPIRGMGPVGAGNTPAAEQQAVQSGGDQAPQGNIVGGGGLRMALRLTAACGVVNVDEEPGPMDHHVLSLIHI